MGRLLSLLAIGIVSLILPVDTASSQERPPLIPPKRFDHPFKGKLVEHRGDIQEVQMWCATMYGKPFPYLVEGCALPMGTRCEVAFTRKAVRRHEIAHCNGWPEHHPR
jgi:hypothetical protein